MDGTEDSSYLTLLHDGTHNYLLETNEETLGIQDPSLNVEPMFTEIDDANGGWSIGLPILMNGNLIPEADNELESSMSLPAEATENAVENNIDLPSTLEALYNEPIEDQQDSLQMENVSDQNQITYPIEYNAVTTDHIFISNDLLLQLNLRNKTTENGGISLAQGNTEGIENQQLAQMVEQNDVIINEEQLIPRNAGALNHTEMTNYETEQSSQEIIISPDLFSNANDINLTNEEDFGANNIMETAEEIIQILNGDGTVLSIDKKLLNFPLSKVQAINLENGKDLANEEIEENIEDCFEIVTAHKCKKCSFLYEKIDDAIKHWKSEHHLAAKSLENLKENNVVNEMLTPEDVLQNGLQDESQHLLRQLQKNNIGECKTKPENWKEIILHSQLQKQQMQERVSSLTEHWKNVQLTVQESEQKANENTPSSSLLVNKDQEENQMNGIITDAAGNKVILKSILKNADQKMVYICSECNLGFGSMDKLRHHMIMVHKLVQKPTELETQKNDNDKLINETAKNSGKKPKLTIALIQRQARASKKIKCSVKGCELRFAMDDMRIRHEKCHVEGQKKQFKCFECNSKFSLWRVCSMHMWKCHKVDLGLYTCPMCSVVKVSTPFRLMSHMAIHEDDKPFLCNVCGKSFKQHSQLRNHQVIHKEAHEIPDWATQQQCEICKKYFANSKCLKKHIQCVHDKFKPFICNICGHKSGRKSMLNLHLRQHTGEKPHKCPICEFRTGDHNSLRRHIMRHSGNTKYSCPHCDYQSIQSTSYKNHIASKHPGLGGSFFCSLCSYHTVNENTYMSHIADHKNGLIKETANNKNNENDEIYNNLATITGENSSPNMNNQNRKRMQIRDVEDDETQTYLTSIMDHSNDAVDTGGITIPAGLELQVPL